MRLLPASATADARLLLETRGTRALVDGLVTVILPVHLALLGVDATGTGAIVTATLLGSAALTLGVGVWGGHLARRRLLRAVSLLMIATGVAFALGSGFAVLLVVAFVGTVNPTGGDVSVFLPTEQALLPATVDPDERTALVARYTLVGFVLAAVGAALAGVPDALARRTGLAPETVSRCVFAVYAVGGLVLLVRYRALSGAVEHPAGAPRRGLGPSRRTVYRLAATFSLDSFGGGFVVQSIVALWLFRRFELSVAAAGALFFWVGLLAGFSGLVAARLARRLGLVRTMVFTHLPANAFLVLTAFMPTLPTAVACLLARAALAQMDVPARTSYVLAVVTPEERPAAAAVTNVPRALAAALPPVAAGWMLDRTTFGWPLVIGGCLKAVYDLLLLWQFHDLRPPEERR